MKIFAEPHDIKEVRSLVSKMLKTCKILEENDGGAIASFQITNFDELDLFFKVIENKSEEDGDSRKLRGLVKNWGLTHSTLEEVFMKITGEKGK